MRYAFAIVAAAGLAVGTAPEAKAQFSLSVGNPYGGGLYVGNYGYGLGSPYGVYSSGYYGIGAPYGVYSSGYYGVPSVFSSGYYGLGGYRYGYPRAFGYAYPRAFRYAFGFPRAYRYGGFYGRRWFGRWW
jgi:hypothetical protein